MEEQGSLYSKLWDGVTKSLKWICIVVKIVRQTKPFSYDMATNLGEKSQLYSA